MIQLTIVKRGGQFLDKPTTVGIDEDKIVLFRRVGSLFAFSYAETEDHRISNVELETAENLEAILPLTKYYNFTVLKPVGQEQVYLRISKIIDMVDGATWDGTPALKVRFNKGVSEVETFYTTGTLDDYVSPSEMVLEITTPSDAYVMSGMSDSAGTYDAEVDWGDGTIETITVWSDFSHTYATAGTYQIKIKGTYTQFNDILSATNFKTVIRKIINWGDTGLTTLAQAFYQSGLNEIISPIIHTSNLVTNSFENTFAGCQLTYLPEGLLSYVVHKDDYIYTFSDNSSLTSLPINLFGYQPQCTKISDTFVRCGLISLPTDLLSGMPNLIELGYGTFSENPLTSIPQNLFANNPKLTTVDGLWYACTSLTSIPEKLFANNPLLDYASDLWDGTGVTDIPGGLFDNNPLLTNVSYNWYGAPITALPSGLFDNNPLLISIRSMCQACTSLTDVPIDLFDNNTALNDARNAFNGCSAITSNVPVLWAAPFSVTNFTGCYTDCTNAANYADIPNNWKGL